LGKQGLKMGLKAVMERDFNRHYEGAFSECLKIPSEKQSHAGMRLLRSARNDG
jgi:dynactin complex subunit